MAQCLEAQRFHHGAQHCRSASELDDQAERCGRELVERVAVGEDQATDAAVIGVDEELAQRATGVVADEGDIGEPERGDEVVHQPGDASRAEIGARRPRNAVRTERQVRGVAADAEAGEGIGDLRPQFRVHE
ncbi:hypothetical protein Prum_062140 [Phytohabitans rumicis]|uniref:Uncharacterized protein n=1 Tax=Phytohabitans rumicis TaxID=1076125 RepID=A0A6V8L5P3_9ACTN|nr:hypothetical protein Prum_062140 [Phytohabitans rumicis]